MKRHNIRTIAGVLAFGLVMALPAVASAWTCAVEDCSIWCGGGTSYTVGTLSNELGDEVSLTEVRAGMEDWTLNSCSKFNLTYGGPTTDRPGGQMDGNNVVSWTVGRWRYGGFTIGLTLLWGLGDGCILEGDVELNDQDFSWTTERGAGFTVNAYTIIHHEAGHFIGLGHTADPSAIMFPSYDGGTHYATGDDVAGVCDLYAGGALDCAQTGCSRGQFCAEGSCHVPDGPGLTCMPCSDNADCGEEGDQCLTYPNGTFCGRACETNGDCGGGATECLEVDGGAKQCVRRDLAGAPSCDGCRSDIECSGHPDGFFCAQFSGNCIEPPPRDKEVGDACQTRLECLSDICTLDGVCTQYCDRLSESPGCPEDFHCGGSLNVACGASLCVPGNNGSKAVNEACEADDECESSACYLGNCVEPCFGFGQASCDNGYECQLFPGGCGFCRSDGQIGSRCVSDAQCEAGTCLEVGQEQLCSIECGAEVVCPIGTECLETAGRDLCLRPTSGKLAIGEPCISADECDSGACALGEDGYPYCATTCERDAQCPSGFACNLGTCQFGAASGPGFDLFPGGGQGGGCAVAPLTDRPTAPLAWLLIGLVSWAVWRPRTQRL